MEPTSPLEMGRRLVTIQRIACPTSPSTLIVRSTARALVAAVVALSAWGYTLAFGGEFAMAQPAARSNVLIVVTDDQRATNTLWVMGKTRRYLQRGGVRYSNAFAVTPLCCPSRATILTGRYAHNHGVLTQASAPLDRTTLFPRLLQQAGYQTAMAGKFLNRWHFETDPPYFDQWAMLCLCGRDPPSTFNVNGVTSTLWGDSTGLIGRYAVRFLRRFEENDATPWFLYVAPTAPHPPWRASPKYADRTFPTWRGNPAVLERDRSDKPEFVRRQHHGLRGARKARTGQLRELLAVDGLIGRLSSTLSQLREGANTLVIFTSDNGFIWSEHGIGRGRKPGQKRLPYTASVKVPLLVRWPERLAAGLVDNRLVGTVDIAPTVLDAAGVDPDPSKPPLDGRSILDPWERDRILLEYWIERTLPTWASLRTNAFQYTEYYANDGTTPTFREYYNLARDPWQLRNLLHDGTPANNPDVALLSAQLRQDRRCADATGPDACP
jgi:arylsulfatase A-like enzyme